MKCRRAKQLVFDFLDGVIADSDRINLEHHLNQCKSCEEFTSGIAKSLDLLHHAPMETPSENFNWKVRLQLAREKNAIGEAIAAQQEVFKSWNLRFALSAFSAFVLILASGYFLWSSGLLIDQTEPVQITAEVPTQQRQEPPVDPTYVAGESRSWFSGAAPQMQTTVSGGNIPILSDPLDYRPPIDEESPLVLKPDSLVMMKLKSMPMRYRLRQLESQVELLQKYLRECEAGKR